MQTFLPSPSFSESAAALDNLRLGNQCYRETKTLFCGGWANHPASKMWIGHYNSLARYGLACAIEMGKRTKPDGSPKWRSEVVERWVAYWSKAVSLLPDNGDPEWLGRPKLHESHRRALLLKDFRHYSKLWPDLEPISLDSSGKIPYVWPV